MQVIGYTIKKGNLYVTVPGSASSYTQNILYARIFATKQDAEREKCGNETVVLIDSEFRKRKGKVKG